MASKGVNKVILLGNVGQDPDCRYLPNGKAVASISLATSEVWKDDAGQSQERTEWHRVVFFGRTAEIVGEYVKKGSKIYVEGQNRTRKWQDQSGADRYTTEVVARELQMLSGGNSSQSNQYSAYPEAGGDHSEPPPAPPGSDFEDDIPF